MDELAEKLDRIAEALARRPRPREILNPLILVNEAERTYTVINLYGFVPADEKPTDLMRRGYRFVSKYQADLCRS